MRIFLSLGRSAYDRFARPYNVSRVLDLTTLRFNETAYEEYSPLYLPISFALTYLLGFAVPPAVLIHTVLVHWPTIWSTIRRRRVPEEEREDVHAKLMRRYPQAPWWWYASVFVVSLLLSVGATEVRFSRLSATARRMTDYLVMLYVRRSIRSFSFPLEQLCSP